MAVIWSTISSNFWAASLWLGMELGEDVDCGLAFCWADRSEPSADWALTGGVDLRGSLAREAL